ETVSSLAARVGDAGVIRLEAPEWNDLIARISSHAPATREAGGGLSLPPDHAFPLFQDDSSWFSQSLLEQTASRMTIATASWPRVSFDAWWSQARALVEPVADAPDSLT